MKKKYPSLILLGFLEKIKHKRLLFVLITTLFYTSISAQVIIPASNTSNGSVNDPFGTWYGYERSAMIYTNAEIGRTGSITNVGFFVNSVSSPGTAVNVRIYMKMRTSTFTSNTNYATETTGSTLVYGPASFASSSFVSGNWTSVQLTTPFNYTGNNLEIIVETSQGTNGNESNTGKQFRYATQPDNELYQAWNADTNAPTGLGTRSPARPNVRLVIATYCTSVPNTNLPDGLTSVQFNTINDAVASAATIPYTDNTSFNTNVTRGQTYPINVSANTDGNFKQFQTVWFDWNRDGDFDDSGETYQLGSVTNNPNGLSSLCPLSITVPLTATLGQTRMRVAARYASPAIPCENEYHGEVRDYSVTVTGAVSYCSPSSNVPNGLYITSVAFLGALTDPPVNTSTFSATGYQNFTTLPTKAVQAQGEGINITARTAGNNIVRGRWKAWVDWNKDGVFQPATEEIYNTGGYVGDAATFGFVIPIAAPPGDYRLRIMVNNSLNGSTEGFGYNFSPCDNFSTAGTTKYYGETEDYLFTVVAKCNSLITAVTNGENCGSGTVNLSAVATAGVTQFRWYTTPSGGSYTTSTVSGTSTTFTTPSLTTTRNYYVTAWNGSCESQVRTLVVAKVNPTPIVAFTPSEPVVCGENAIIQLKATADKELIYLIDEDFESGGLGLFSNINNDANDNVIDGITSWRNQTSTFVPSTSTWFPAISSGFGTNKFALAYSESIPLPTNTVENSISLTNVVNSNNFLNLTLKLKMYYSRYISDGYINPAIDEYVNIELSTDGGTTYPKVIESIVRDIGIGTRFAELSYDLSAHINEPNLKIRVRHRSFANEFNWYPDGVAIDDVELFGEKPLNTAFNYDTATVNAFTDASATIPYTSGTPISTIYIKPTVTQLENITFSIPVSTILANGCSANGSVTVTNNTKLFVAGTVGTDWNTATNWKPNGVPTAENCVIIFDNDVNISGTNYTGYGKNLIVKPAGNLKIAPSNSSVITDFVSVENGGLFNIENTASLIQINNVANSGNISMKRTTSIKKFDYVYWSSPVLNFPVTNISTTSYRYKWLSTIASNTNGWGNWASTSENMEKGKGYIVRAPDNYTTTPQNYTASFVGVPNNGTITIPITRGTYDGVNYTTATSTTQATKDDDNWNLIGNPYPSAINADSFLNTNSSKIESWIEVWTHGMSPSTVNANPFYQNFGYNYSVSDYLRYNATGATQIGFDGQIGAGQAFMVLMKHAATSPNTVRFENNMRSKSYRNDQFFRTTDSTSIEKNRIWLQLISPNGDESKSLLGYISGASNAFDSKYDADNIGVKTDFELYSLIERKGLSIQGKALPFDVNDEVPLGVTIPQTGTYIIAIAAVDGLFTDTTQDIYIEDKLNGITHNLRVNPYSFSTTSGKFENRFVLKYNNTILNTDTFTANEVKVYASENINIIATNQTIKSVRVYDILGRVLGNFENVQASTFSTATIAKTSTTLLVEVTLENGAKNSYKVIY